MAAQRAIAAASPSWIAQNRLRGALQSPIRRVSIPVCSSATAKASSATRGVDQTNSATSSISRSWLVKTLRQVRMLAGVSLCQRVRNAIGCSAVIHVEKNSSSLRAFRAGFRVPVARGEALACEIVRPTLVRARCDNNSLRFYRENGVHVCHLTGLDPDAGFASLVLQPCDQTEVFVAARKIDLPIKLPSKLGRMAEQGHIVPSLSGHRSRLQSCRAGTDDGDAPSFCGLRRTPARLALLPELRIVDFSKRLAGVYLAPTKIVVA